MLLFDLFVFLRVLFNTAAGFQLFDNWLINCVLITFLYPFHLLYFAFSLFYSSQLLGEFLSEAL